MKILRFNPTEDSPKLFTLQFNFNPDSGILSGSVGTNSNSGDLIKEFSIDLNNWKGKLIEATLTTTNLGYEVAVYDALKNYSMANGLPETPGAKWYGLRKLFRVIVHENLTESLIQIRQGHDQIDGFENIVEDGDPTLQLYNLCQKDSLAIELVERARIKSDMLGKIDQRNSVAYLEAQVDLLTRLYLQDHPEKTNTLIELLKQADSHSVLNIKNETKLTKEFTENKALVRQVQEEFYDKLLNGKTTIS